MGLLSVKQGNIMINDIYKNWSHLLDVAIVLFSYHSNVTTLDVEAQRVLAISSP